eukprot:764951-Hanusia_phi.AAC.5
MDPSDTAGAGRRFSRASDRAISARSGSSRRKAHGYDIIRAYLIDETMNGAKCLTCDIIDSPWLMLAQALLDRNLKASVDTSCPVLG